MGGGEVAVTGATEMGEFYLGDVLEIGGAGKIE